MNVRGTRVPQALHCVYCPGAGVRVASAPPFPLSDLAPLGHPSLGGGKDWPVQAKGAPRTDRRRDCQSERVQKNGRQATSR